ncbi:hypothetical protein AAFM79_07970 [Trichormus azollae HNT15244]
MFIVQYSYVVILRYRSIYQNFKDYYRKHIRKYWQAEFPQLVSYQRFIELMLNTLMPLIYDLNSRKISTQISI